VVHNICKAHNIPAPIELDVEEEQFDQRDGNDNNINNVDNFGNNRAELINRWFRNV
jgi:hypothetical protein